MVYPLNLRVFIASIFIFWSSIATTSRSTLPPTVVIENDFGGSVNEYGRRFEQLREANARIVFKGTCASACARFMSLPGACAAPKAVFAFHAIWNRKDGTIYPAESEQDSRRFDLPAAYRLQRRYNAFSMGFTYTRPYEQKLVEPGVRIEYTSVRGPKGQPYQELLFVNADKLVPVCTRRVLRFHQH